MQKANPLPLTDKPETKNGLVTLFITSLESETYTQSRGKIRARVFTHSLFSPVHTWLPDQCVIAELHLVGMHNVPAVCEQKTHIWVVNMAHVI